MFGIDFSKVRMARLLHDKTTKEEVEAFLPDNYAAVVLADGLHIVGSDRAGWTLDGYVIPRLASGLIFAEEVTK